MEKGPIYTPLCESLALAPPHNPCEGMNLILSTLADHFTGENLWLHLSLISGLRKACLEVFPNVEYAYTTIPTYPGGQIGFMVCCKDAKRNLREPLRSWGPEEEEKLCRYNNKQYHKTSFVLPTFARKVLR